MVTDIGANDKAFALAQTYEGKLLVAGDTSGNTQFVVVKYAENGLRDGLFGNNGIVTTDFGETSTGGAGIAVGPGRRFVVAGGQKFHTARYLDSGANVVYATPLIDPTGGEAGQNQASFLVYRSERLPTPTRVYFSIGGTATSPFIKAVKGQTYDYTLDGLTIPIDIFTGTNGTPYVDILANQTFAAVYLIPVDDTRVEGGERALLPCGRTRATKSARLKPPTCSSVTTTADRSPA